MTRMDDLPVRDELRGRSPYGAPELDVPVHLNVNENPYAPPAWLADRIAERVGEAVRDLNRYPDREANALRAALAGYLTRSTGHPLDERHVWAANGSNEVLQQLLQAFGGPGRVALGFEPSYSVHPLAARGTGTGWAAGPRGDDFSVDVPAARAAIAEHRPDVLLITSPNNPTGTAVDADTVLALYEAAQRAKPCLVVVDEAYAEFSRGPSLVPLIAGRPHLVVARTLSKAFGAAALRLGYLAADPGVVEALRLVRLPYHLSSVTQAIALTVLEHADVLLARVEEIKAERDRVVAELTALGYEVTPSDANFVQFGRFEDGHRVWEAILGHGVLIRDSGVPGRLRASVGTPAENDAFLDAARAVAKELSGERTRSR
ncbi:histidinol-phosphate transaminase [Streptomyces sp. C36]|uniref:histidinol-phosphate transaminase n=1 Tax=Streptomyces sp. C36 TaxID=3237122 RepID=UPI0034C5D9D9